MKKSGFKKLGKSFLKYAQNASKNIDKVNDNILGKSPPKPKTPSKPKVKKAPKVKKPQPASKPNQQGQGIVNVYTGNQPVSSPQSSSKKSSSKKRKKKAKRKKKRTTSSNEYDPLYGYSW